MTTWAEIRPGDVVIMKDRRYRVKRFDVSTGTFTLVDKDNQEYPGQPRLDASVKTAPSDEDAEALLANVLGARPLATHLCPACGHVTREV